MNERLGEDMRLIQVGELVLSLRSNLGTLVTLSDDVDRMDDKVDNMAQDESQKPAPSPDDDDGPEASPVMSMEQLMGQIGEAWQWIEGAATTLLKERESPGYGAACHCMGEMLSGLHQRFGGRSLDDSGRELVATLHDSLQGIGADPGNISMMSLGHYSADFSQRYLGWCARQRG